jgi:hypothetical protein
VAPLFRHPPKAFHDVCANVTGSMKKVLALQRPSGSDMNLAYSLVRVLHMSYNVDTWHENKVLYKG